MFSRVKPRTVALIAVLPALAVMMVGCGGSMGMVSSLLKVAGVRAVIPKNWSSHGGFVAIVADIVSGESLKRVVAKVIKRNMPEPIEVILTLNAEGKYEGTFETTDNPSEAAPVVYTAVVEATDASGNTATSQPVEVEVPPAP